LYGILDFALLEVVHVDVDTICVLVSFELLCCGGNLPSPITPVDIMVAALALAMRKGQYLADLKLSVHG
jgi:hypothetical protein